MGRQDDIAKLLPLTEATYYIMLSLVEPLHGYAVMQNVDRISKGTVKVGPGTLYGVFTALENAALIIKVKEEERRKSYVLTPKGKRLLLEQIKRTEIMAQNGLEVINILKSNQPA